MIDAVALAQALVRCPSVTPADAGAQDVLAEALAAHGFEVHRLRFGEAPDGPIDNLFATRGQGYPHFAFAGHTDVVPPGDTAHWATPPFDGEIVGGYLHGRGTADMKGAIGAFAAAAAATPQPPAGRLSFIITGDEEGPATFGTAPLLAWLAARNLVPDLCLVGEPTSAHALGDTVKIGRRGSLNAWITVPGTQGHVAYPDKADNPITRLVAALAALEAREFDDGSDWFQPSNLEITDISVGNPAANLIPAEARARINIRFNDRHEGRTLEAWLRDTVAACAPRAEVVVRISGEAFLTEPGALSDIVGDSIAKVTGRAPGLSTTGGTSDARFISQLCPVIEFGLVGATMHKLDEAVPVADIVALQAIYAGVIDLVFASDTLPDG